MRTFYAALIEKSHDNGWLINAAAKNWISLCTCILAIIVAYIMHLVEKQYLIALDKAAKFFLVSPPPKPALVVINEPAPLDGKTPLFA